MFQFVLEKDKCLFRFSSYNTEFSKYRFASENRYLTSRKSFQSDVAI